MWGDDIIKATRLQDQWANMHIGYFISLAVAGCPVIYGIHILRQLAGAVKFAQSPMAQKALVYGSGICGAIIMLAAQDVVRKLVYMLKQTWQPANK